MIKELGFETNVVEFKNENNEVVLRQKFKTAVQNTYSDEKFAEVQNFYDKKGRLTSIVKSYNRDNNQLTKQHSLKPTLLGSQYYYQVLNELI